MALIFSSINFETVNASTTDTITESYQISTRANRPMDGSGGASMAPKGGGLGGRVPIHKPKPKPKQKKEHQVISSYNNALKKGQKTNSHKVNHAKSLPSSGKAYSSAYIYTGGKLNLRQYYDGNGKAQTDIHYSNHGNAKPHPKVPHRHNWGWHKGKWAPGNSY